MRVTVVNYSPTGKTVVVSSSDDVCELDAVCVEGRVLVQIDTTVNVLEGLQRSALPAAVRCRSSGSPIAEVVRDLVGVVRLHQVNGQLTSKRRITSRSDLDRS